MKYLDKVQEFCRDSYVRIQKCSNGFIIEYQVCDLIGSTGPIRKKQASIFYEYEDLINFLDNFYNGKVNDER